MDGWGACHTHMQWNVTQTQKGEVSNMRFRLNLEDDMLSEINQSHKDVRGVSKAGRVEIQRGMGGF